MISLGLPQFSQHLAEFFLSNSFIWFCLWMTSTRPRTELCAYRYKLILRPWWNDNNMSIAWKWFLLADGCYFVAFQPLSPKTRPRPSEVPRFVRKRLFLARVDVTCRHKGILQIRFAGTDKQILWLLCRFTNSSDSMAIETFAKSRVQVNSAIRP
jgi:hypothetical protein